MKIDQVLRAARQSNISPERTMKLLAIASLYRALNMQRSNLFEVVKERTVYSTLELLREMGLVQDTPDAWAFLGSLETDKYQISHVAEALYLDSTDLNSPRHSTETVDVKTALLELTNLVKQSLEVQEEGLTAASEKANDMTENQLELTL